MLLDKNSKFKEMKDENSTKTEIKNLKQQNVNDPPHSFSTNFHICYY
jgi:hypothetical protein